MFGSVSAALWIFGEGPVDLHGSGGGGGSVHVSRQLRQRTQYTTANQCTVEAKTV